MSANPIQMESIVAALDFFNVTDCEDRYDYLEFIHCLDVEKLEWHRKQAKTNANP